MGIPSGSEVSKVQSDQKLVSLNQQVLKVRNCITHSSRYWKSNGKTARVYRTCKNDNFTYFILGIYVYVILKLTCMWIDHIRFKSLVYVQNLKQTGILIYSDFLKSISFPPNEVLLYTVLENIKSTPDETSTQISLCYIYSG